MYLPCGFLPKASHPLPVRTVLLPPHREHPDSGRYRPHWFPVSILPWSVLCRWHFHFSLKPLLICWRFLLHSLFPVPLLSAVRQVLELPHAVRLKTNIPASTAVNTCFLFLISRFFLSAISLKFFRQSACALTISADSPEEPSLHIFSAAPTYWYNTAPSYPRRQFPSFLPL